MQAEKAETRLLGEESINRGRRVPHPSQACTNSVSVLHRRCCRHITPFLPWNRHSIPSTRYHTKNSQCGSAKLVGTQGPAASRHPLVSCQAPGVCINHDKISQTKKNTSKRQERNGCTPDVGYIAKYTARQLTLSYLRENE